jgi:chromosome partitioning protein
LTTLAFFGSKGGVGKTTLVYHLAWMFAEHGVRTLAVDLDPQASLSALFLDDDRLGDVWKSPSGAPHIERVTDALHLVVSDIALSTCEDSLSESWSKCVEAQKSAFSATLAFHQMIANAMAQTASKIVLIDLGSNFGAINRSALLATDGIILPIAPDLLSIKRLKSAGTVLERWRDQWAERMSIASTIEDLAALPSGEMDTEGYVIVEPGLATRQSTASHRHWLNQIPQAYDEFIMRDASANTPPEPESDPNRLGTINHYFSLMPLAKQARKPMFSLKPADGAIGSHVEAVQACYRRFFELASTIAAKNGIDLK